ncbi:MAG: BlaI/MecI/CopY family transcriptional regulator [Rhodothermales bacterium]
MKNAGNPKPTAAELTILNVLWTQGPATVREVHNALPDQKTGYTTVLKLLQIMLEKGLVKRDSSSRAHIYDSAFQAEDVQTQLVENLLTDAFQGSAKNLILRALSVKPSSAEELAEIRKLIDKLDEES